MGRACSSWIIAVYLHDPASTVPCFDGIPVADVPVAHSPLDPPLPPQRVGGWRSERRSATITPCAVLSDEPDCGPLLVPQRTLSSPRFAAGLDQTDGHGCGVCVGLLDGMDSLWHDPMKERQFHTPFWRHNQALRDLVPAAQLLHGSILVHTRQPVPPQQQRRSAHQTQAARRLRAERHLRPALLRTKGNHTLYTFCRALQGGQGTCAIVYVAAH